MKQSGELIEEFSPTSEPKLWGTRLSASVSCERQIVSAPRFKNFKKCVHVNLRLFICSAQMAYSSQSTERPHRRRVLLALLTILTLRKQPSQKMTSPKCGLAARLPRAQLQGTEQDNSCNRVHEPLLPYAHHHRMAHSHSICVILCIKYKTERAGKILNPAQ